jgi:hypothetical protein
MKIIRYFIFFALFCLMVFSTACQRETNSNWYPDSFIHTHISIGFDSSWKDDFVEQVRVVKPDVIEFHSTSQSSWPEIKLADELSETLGFRLAMTINKAGSWRPPYDEDPRYVFRKNPDGSRAGRWGRKHLCVNAPAVDEIIIPYYAKAAETFKPDQIWIDENVITINVCYCDYCVKLYKKQTHNAPPVEPGDLNWPEWVTFHRHNFEEWMRKVYRAVKDESPHTLVTFNHAWFVEQPEEPPEFIENLCADIHHDPLKIGLYARYGAVSGVPYDIMPGLGSDIWGGVEPKTTEQIKEDVAIITANSGRWNIGEFPTNKKSVRKDWNLPDGRPADEYLKLADLGATFARERKQYTHKTQSMPYVAILHSASTHYDKVIPRENRPGSKDDDELVLTSDGTYVSNARSEEKTRIYWPNNKPVPNNIIGAHEALLENHIHHDIIHESHLQKQLHFYKVLILSEQYKLAPATIEKVKAFVEQGGIVLATGSTIESGLQKIFGCKVESYTTDHADFEYKGARFTLPGYYRIQPSSAQVRNTFQNPENHAMITKNTVGDGKAVYIAGDYFTQYYSVSPFSGKTDESADESRLFVRSLFDSLLQHPLYAFDAPDYYEVVVNKKNASLFVHLVNRSIEWKTKSISPMDHVHMKLKIDEPKKVVLQPNDIKIKNWSYTDGLLVADVPLQDIDMHGIVEIIY